MAGKQLIHSSLRRVTRPQIYSSQQCRHFTSTRRNRQQGTGSARDQIARQMGNEKTMQSRMSRAKGSEIPTDLGLFPDTLIKPERRDLPSLFSSQLKKRARIEWTAFWQKSKDFVSLVFQKKWMVKKHLRTKKRMTEPLYLRNRYFEARELHNALFTALAKGDRATISEIACTGLQNALRTRLDHRRAINGPEESWSIKYRGWTPSAKTWWIFQALCPAMFKSTRIIADRSGSIPIGKEGKIRQVVVKIKSTQTLDKDDGKGPKTKDVDEYVVIQQMSIDGIEDKWMIWGTTQPSTTKQIDEMFKSSTDKLSWMDRIATTGNLKM